MGMTKTNIMPAVGILLTLRQFVTATKLHPILVNFRAALVPISVGSDLAARLVKSESLRNAKYFSSVSEPDNTPAPVEGKAVTYQ